MEPQKGTPLDYGSEFCNITSINKSFSHHEDKDIIAETIQKGSHCHLSPI